MSPTSTAGREPAAPGAAVLDAARALLALPDFPGTSDEREERLRVVLDQVAIAFDQTNDFSTDQEFPEPASINYEALRARFATAFPGLGLYSAVFDPLTPEAQPGVTMGDALDDLTDIARDLQEVLDRSEGSLEDAIWHFRFGYKSHWGRHLRWLQLVVHERWARRAPLLARAQPRLPDAIVEVRLLPTSLGGRNSKIGAVTFGCPVFLGDQRDQANDCRFYFDEAGAGVAPGGSASGIPVRFLCPDLVRDKLHPGARFTLWEGRDIGEAVITAVPTS